MKTLFIYLFLFCAYIQILHAQKHDYTWLLGYDSYGGRPWGGTNILFNGGIPDTIWEYRDMNFYCTDASISDENGNLQFYSNGIFIANYQNDTMANGSGINLHPSTTQWQENGMPMIQGNLILPLPNSKNMYYLFHETIDVLTSELGGHPTQLFYSVIDMSHNNGLGEVIAKNQILATDTFVFGCLTSVKHANGRDWWIVVPRFDSNIYYKMLLTPTGISSVDTQAIGGKLPKVDIGQACFSPNGNRYARYDGNNGVVYYFDFDRCTGLFSNPIDWVVANNLGSGCAFSPNSNVLYISEGLHIFQYNLLAADIPASQMMVGQYDGFQSPFACTINMAQLAPDGKIYLNATNGVNVLHVINYPDSLANMWGTNCGVGLHSFALPSYNASSLPNFPNYRLGAAIGSGCDTILSTTYMEDKIDNQKAFIYPNPAQSTVNISSPDIAFQQISICNALGQILQDHHYTSPTQAATLSLAELPKGLYFLKVYTEKGVESMKLLH